MDALDRVAAPGRDLLDRVDAALVAAGAPASDPIWPLMRRTGALPGEALEFALGLDAESMLAAAAELRARAAEYAQRHGELAVHVGAGVWEGSSAEAFNALWRALGDHIGDGAAADQLSLTGRLLATSSYLDSVAHWVTWLRGELAATVAAALRSAEAVTLRGVAPVNAFDMAAMNPTTSEALTQAAATVGALVLDTMVESMRAGHDLHGEWAPWLVELPYRSPADTGPTGASAITRVEL
jgi:hypothetical protein